MTKPELGTKRLCARCGAKFYDLHHSPITCPQCDAVFDAVQVNSRWRVEAARKVVSEVEPTVTETEEAKSVSLENADAKPRIVADWRPFGDPDVASQGPESEAIGSRLNPLIRLRFSPPRTNQMTAVNGPRRASHAKRRTRGWSGAADYVAG